MFVLLLLLSLLLYPRNNQWLGAAKAMSPFATDMGVGPVPTNVKTSLAATAPGDRQKKIAAKVLREKRDQEKALRQQRLQERAAIMKRVVASSPSRSPTRAGGREQENGRDNAEPTAVEKILQDEIAKVKQELADQLKVQAQGLAQAQAKGPGPGPDNPSPTKQKHKGQGQGQGPGQEGEDQGETTDGSVQGLGPRALSRGASRGGQGLGTARGQGLGAGKPTVTMAPLATGGLGLGLGQGTARGQGLGLAQGQGLVVTMSPEVLAVERKRAVTKTPLAYRSELLSTRLPPNNRYTST